MAADKWQQIEDLFHAALELDPSTRSEFLQDNCDDPAVREEVNSLLAAHQNAGGFIASPAHLLGDLLQHEQDASIPETIGVYKVVREIGRGGMGAVYLAHRADETFQKQVAVKILKSGMDTAEILHHFHNERQILADFDHPNIARLLDGGTTQSGLPYFVMEYVEGLPIDEYCNNRRLSVHQRLKLFREICSAISYAHRHLVIHRDLKPSNILVTNEGVPKLLDFGIAKILNPDRQGLSTATGMQLMTPEYASPEQIVGLPVTTVSDVYSLGVLLFELLVGRLPYDFEGHSALEIARIVHDTQPLISSAALQSPKSAHSIGEMRGTTIEQLRRELRGDLDNILSMAIRKERERRYQSVEQFSEDIRRYLERLPVHARKDTIIYRFTKFTKRNPFATASIVLIFLTLVAGVVATTWQAKKARAEQQRAEYARAFADELRYIETLLLSTYTSPLHDARQNLSIAKKKLNEIENQMQESGSLSYASGNNALGNGYLMLNDYDRAKLYLERAWNAGYQGPSTAYAIGKTFGHLYEQAITNADQLNSAPLKKKAIHEADIQYSKPAVEYLKLAKRSAESPDYVEGLIALYQKRYDDALRKAAQAFKTSSRPYEVMKLQGDVYFNKGRDFVEQGDGKSATEAFERSGEAYAHAAETARSDPDIYIADARRLTRMISLEKKDASDMVALAITTCDKAIQINPEAQENYLLKSEIYLQEGINEMYNAGKDPRPAFRNAVKQVQQLSPQKKSAYEGTSKAFLRTGEYELSINADARNSLKQSIDAAEEALALDPHFADAHLDLAAANFLLAQYQLEHGEDPTELLNNVIEIYDKQLSSLPKDLYSLNLLALAHQALAEYQTKRGIDPQRELEQTLKLYKTALHMNPSATYLDEGLGLTYVDLAKYQIQVGIDPEPALQLAIDSYHKSVDDNPQSWALFNLALAHITRAEHRFKIQKDPEEDLVAAEKHLQKSQELTTDLPPAKLQSAAAHILQARFLFASGKNPVPEIDKAQTNLNTFSKYNEANAEGLLAQSTIHLMRAKWRNKQRLDSTLLLDQAISYSEKAISQNPNDANAYVQLASIYRLRVEIMAGEGKEVEQWIELGLRKTDAAQKINPSLEALALRGCFLHFKSNLTKDPDLGHHASEMIKEALSKNPFLKSEYASCL